MIVCANDHTLCMACTVQIDACPVCREPCLTDPVTNWAVCVAAEARDTDTVVAKFRLNCHDKVL